MGRRLACRSPESRSVRRSTSTRSACSTGRTDRGCGSRGFRPRGGRPHATRAPARWHPRAEVRFVSRSAPILGVPGHRRLAVVPAARRPVGRCEDDPIVRHEKVPRVHTAEPRLDTEGARPAAVKTSRKTPVTASTAPAALSHRLRVFISSPPAGAPARGLTRTGSIDWGPAESQVQMAPARPVGSAHRSGAVQCGW